VTTTAARRRSLESLPIPFMLVSRASGSGMAPVDTGCRLTIRYWQIERDDVNTGVDCEADLP
jgi:hypothetical protein